ncbi:efflux RND transporter periplasmic adaptor subunit [Shewanella sp. SNU WT4]|uniref:efflux RND transporter periplasmic adaptor subunit n=1 Tax=Shewanella sp. SNU WT4 TaxID=2590015 RepID=UPI001F1184C6|nr:efflux RND transporter periplasmic adaptor subunit [Shewanella sp. SNU WT4]
MSNIQPRVKALSMSIKSSLALLASLSLSACLFGCQPEVIAVTIKPAVPVTSEVLTQVSGYEQQQQYTGTVRAANTTDIGFEQPGKIELLSVDSGDSVKRHQVLARLDTRVLQAMERELQAALAQNQIDIDLAKRTVSRSNQLKNSQYIAEQQFDELQSRVDKLLANQRQQTANLQRIQLQLEKSVLTAPFDGVVAQKFANLGEVVNQGNAIFTLIGQNQPTAYIGVPSQVSSKLSVGQTLPLTVGEQHFAGVLAGISGELNPISRTVELRITLPQDATVYNGELAYLTSASWTATPGFWVPIGALTDGIRGRWNILALVQPTPAATETELEQTQPQPQLQPNVATTPTNHWLIERRDVHILYSHNDKAYITGAITAGEQIVTAGQHKLVSGQAVTPSRIKG